MDRGAWRAAVHGVAESWTGLKQLSTHAHSLIKKVGGPVNGNVGCSVLPEFFELWLSLSCICW